MSGCAALEELLVIHRPVRPFVSAPGDSHRRRGRTAVYDAEQYVFGDMESEGIALADARELVERYLPGWTVKRTRRGSHDVSSSCDLNERTIRLGRQAGKCVVLHEIAHGLVSPSVASHHGISFRLQLLKLVRAEMGSRWESKLRKALVQVGYPEHKR